MPAFAPARGAAALAPPRPPPHGALRTLLSAPRRAAAPRPRRPAACPPPCAQSTSDESTLVGDSGSATDNGRFPPTGRFRADFPAFSALFSSAAQERMLRDAEATLLKDADGFSIQRVVVRGQIIEYLAPRAPAVPVPPPTLPRTSAEEAEVRSLLCCCACVCAGVRVRCVAGCAGAYGGGRGGGATRQEVCERQNRSL
jgi:hypothetical protein